MAKSITTKYGAAGLLIENYFVDSLTTVNATPVLIASIPIPQNKTYDMEVYMIAVKSDGSTRNCGYTRAVFSRITTDIAQDGTVGKDLRGQLSTAQISFTINNTTHVVEIYANGTTATIDWLFNIQLRYKA